MLILEDAATANGFIQVPFRQYYFEDFVGELSFSKKTIGAKYPFQYARCIYGQFVPYVLCTSYMSGVWLGLVWSLIIYPVLM